MDTERDLWIRNLNINLTWHASTADTAPTLDVDHYTPIQTAQTSGKWQVASGRLTQGVEEVHTMGCEVHDKRS